MSEITPERLDAIEAQLVREAQFFGTFDSQVSMSREDVLALCKALRAAWAERGRVVGVQHHRDVTLTTYERANASADAQEPGGER